MSKRITDQTGIGDINPEATLHVASKNIDEVSVIIEGSKKGTQTANLTEWKNSAGTLLASMDINGTFVTQTLSAGDFVYVDLSGSFATVNATTCTATTGTFTTGNIATLKSTTATGTTGEFTTVKSTTCTATTGNITTVNSTTVTGTTGEFTTMKSTTATGTTGTFTTGEFTTVKSTTATATDVHSTTATGTTGIFTTMKSTTATGTTGEFTTVKSTTATGTTGEFITLKSTTCTAQTVDMYIGGSVNTRTMVVSGTADGTATTIVTTPVAVGKIANIEAQVTALCTAGADSASGGAYVVRGVFSSTTAASAHQIEADVLTVVGSANAVWTVQLNPVANDNNVVLSVTGSAGNNIVWIAVVEKTYF